MGIRNAKQIFEEELSGEPLSQDVIIEVIKQAQIDSIEEAIKLCAESAMTKYTFVSTGDYSGFDNWVVDKQSIMDCGEVLKSEL